MKSYLTYIDDHVWGKIKYLFTVLKQLIITSKILEKVDSHKVDKYHISLTTSKLVCGYLSSGTVI